MPRVNLGNLVCFFILIEPFFPPPFLLPSIIIYLVTRIHGKILKYVFIFPFLILADGTPGFSLPQRSFVSGASCFVFQKYTLVTTLALLQRGRLCDCSLPLGYIQDTTGIREAVLWSTREQGPNEHQEAVPKSPMAWSGTEVADQGA